MYERKKDEKLKCESDEGKELIELFRERDGGYMQSQGKIYKCGKNEEEEKGDER